MFSKTLFAVTAFTAMISAPIARAQLIDVTLPVTLALGNTAECPVPAPDDNIDATVLAVVNFDETLVATVNAVGVPVAQAEVSTNGLDVCLCLPVGIDLPIGIPLDLEAQAIADLEAAIAANVDLAAVTAIIDNPLAVVDLDLAPNTRRDCTCPDGAVPTCTAGVCGCDCGTGFTYNASTGMCVLNASAAPAARSKRSRVFGEYEKRQATRASIVAAAQRRL